jgi:hypothetical protein
MIDPFAVIVVTLGVMAGIFLGCWWGVRCLVRWVGGDLPAE